MHGKTKKSWVYQNKHSKHYNIQTNYAISELSLELLNEGYDYILTGRFQSDPLERSFLQYRQLSGGRFLVSLQEVLRLSQ